MSNSYSGRDLVGYADNPPDIVWPNGARVAVSVAVNFEEGAERQVGDGDSSSEHIGEVLSVVNPAVRDYGQEQLFAYGTRVAIWRFLTALQHYKTPATFFFCGRAVSRNADLVRRIVASGHEPACHGWLWRPHADYSDLDSERADIERCVDVIKQACGLRPAGFFCRGSESQWTRQLLAESKFTYTSNAFDDDLPYQDASGLTVVPYNLDCNDMKFFHPNGFVRAQDMIDYVDEALTQLLVESDHGKSSILSVGFHLRISGRPARFRAFTHLLAHLNSLGNKVWVAKRIDIAKAFNSNTDRSFA
jgi:peptidoglycan/xylan/chitin deacetylase (PgdA/CDA1 family)